MKFCLSNRQPIDILKKADEIKIEMRDFRAIPEYLEKYPNKTLILEMENNIPSDFNWDIIKKYSDILNGNFYCAFSNIQQVNECSNRGIKFYYKYPITSFYELEGLKELGVSYALIGIPLIFNLDKVSEYNIPLRVVPNIAYEPYIPHKDGVCGQWIRPEDLEKYGKYIDAVEFYHKDLRQETALYHIYAENKSWPGDLKLLIENLNFSCDNILIYDADNFAERRMNCKQKCLEGRFCTYCYNQLNSEQIIRKYIDYKSNIDF